MNFDYQDVSSILKSNNNYENCSFVGCNLSYLNLIQSKFNNCNFTDSICIGTNFTGCDLSNTNFTNSNLSDANFHNAILENSYLSEAHLENCKGNMKEIKSASFDLWSLVWIRTAKDVDILQVGCQKNTGTRWKTANIKALQRVHPEAHNWFEKYKEVMETLLEISPAIAHGDKPE